MLSQEGAHSQISRNLFRFVVAETIYTGTMSLINQTNAENRPK